MVGLTHVTAVVHRLRQAVDDHDLDRIVDCFHDAYVNETPAHPGRGFRGHAQVRRNWARMLDGIPDLSAEVLRTAVDGSTVWSEWELRGTRRDATAHLMRGVIVFGIEEERAAWSRFYLEPVDDVGDVDQAVSDVLGDPPS